MVKLWQTLLLTLLLCACSHGARQANLAVTTAHYLNPDVSGRPAPIVVSIYQLKFANRFSQTDYQQLNDNAANLLGDNLIDRQDIEIRPGEHRTVHIDLAQDTEFIGLVAHYRNINAAKWRAVISAPPKTSALNLNIELEAQALSVERVR